MAPSPVLTIFLGTYERLLVGLDAFPVVEENAEEFNAELELKMTIGYAAHAGCVKSVAIGGKQFLATGSSDEMIKLYNLKKRKEVGYLQSHAGTITKLAFHSSTYLLSASEDGLVNIYRTKDFELLKSMKGHRSAISGLAIHKSGKVALSVDKDGMLKMWDLQKGRCAYTTHLKCQSDTQKFLHGAKDIPDDIKWNDEHEGHEYAVQFQYHVDIFNSDNPETIKHIFSTSQREKFLCFKYFLGKYGLVGCDNGNILVFDIGSNTNCDLVMKFDAHNGKRVKCMDIIPKFADQKSEYYLITASTDGSVFIWGDLKRAILENKAPKLLIKHSTETRITCMSVLCMNSIAEDDVEKAEKQSEPKLKRVKNK